MTTTADRIISLMEMTHDFKFKMVEFDNSEVDSFKTYKHFYAKTLAEQMHAKINVITIDSLKQYPELYNLLYLFPGIMRVEHNIVISPVFVPKP